jgi:hypothetical protein
MYLPLVHKFMKLTEMMSRVVLFNLSKYRQIIIPFIWSRNNIGKIRNNRKIKGRKPLSQDSFHFEPVESPIDSSTMESPGERYAVRVCLVFVHHQRPYMIVVFSQGLPDVARSSHTETVELRQWSCHSGVVRCTTAIFNVLSYDAPSESVSFVIQSQGKSSTSSPATVP